MVLAGASPAYAAALVTGLRKPRGRPIVARGESREAAEPEAVLRDGHEQRRSTLLDTLTFHLGDTYASRLIPIHAGALGHPRRSKISHGQDPATVLRHAVVKPWLRLAGTARRCSAQQSRRRSVTDAASGSPPNAADQVIVCKRGLVASSWPTGP